MISRIHQRLGTAGFVISIIALVAALGGGAYAASGGLTGKQKKEVEKIAKKYAGKPGATGATGPAGAAGKDGSNGANGSNGTSGTNGKSVVLGNATTASCPAGGKTVEVEGSGTKSNVCNGLTGFTETLPSEKTETGSWSFIAGSGEYAFPALSFPIPLEIPLPGGPGAVHLANFPSTHVAGSEFGSPAACGGSVNQPTAPPGALCIYLGEREGAFKVQNVFQPDGTTGGVGTAGSLIWLTGVEAVEAWANGSWAVTSG